MYNYAECCAKHCHEVVAFMERPQITWHNQRRPWRPPCGFRLFLAYGRTATRCA